MGRYGLHRDRGYSDEEWEFMQAMERYKRTKQRPFPTWREVLGVLKELGYRKVASDSRVVDDSRMR
jgi:hypothetical protein